MGSPAQEESRVAIVTGSTSGIGLDVTNLLLSKGYKVAMSGRRVAHGKKISKSVDPEGKATLFTGCDVSSYSSQANHFQEVWDKWGRIDLVVANAGFVDQESVYNLARKDTAVTDLPAEPKLSATDACLKGVMYSTTLATHFMRHNPKGAGGKIILTGSIIGIHPNPQFPEYCAAKAGVTQWCRSMAPVLLKKENIALNCVMPGAYETAAMPGFETAFKPEQ